MRASGSNDILSGVNEENEQQEKDDKGGEGEIIGTADSVSVGAVSSIVSSRRSASAIVRQNNRPPTYMTPMSRQRARHTNSPQSPGDSDRIGNMMAVMMMNQTADQEERWEERAERCEEFHLQLEMQRQ